jgi:SAM-dependent methyltransferase
MAGQDDFDYERLYAFRHSGTDQATRQQVWREIAMYLYTALGRPARVLDPAAGRGEFINAVPARERWVVDLVDYDDARYDPDVNVVVDDILTASLPDAYFDGVLASNLLEHFERQRDAARFLGRMRQAIAPGGRLAVMGPNFRYCAKEYFDCADHSLALTHTAVGEHLYAAGFEVERVVARFLPYSFRGLLPPSAILTRWYLRAPVVWRVLGKQFLVIGRVPA